MTYGRTLDADEQRWIDQFTTGRVDVVQIRQDVPYRFDPDSQWVESYYQQTYPSPSIPTIGFNVVIPQNKLAYLGEFNEWAAGSDNNPYNSRIMDDRDYDRYRGMTTAVNSARNSMVKSMPPAMAHMLQYQKEQKAEHVLRESNPSLKEAWDNYCFVRALVAPNTPSYNGTR